MGGPETAHARVTRREADVLRGVQEHLSNAEIAARLFVSERTVETHVSSLLRKLGVANRRELARLASAGARPDAGNLPTPAGALIGRGDEVDDVVGLVRSRRLVTLTGPAGVGKTRLAAEVAARVADAYDAGARWVELAAVTDESAVAGRVLHDLGGHDVPGRSALESLAAHVRDRPVLVVLDNCEHLVTAAAVVARTLLDACGAAVVLATSRTPLGVAGEHVVPVRPLTVPDAVALLTDRAGAAGAALSADDAAAADELCRQLDGLPLALELVAPRLRTYTPHQLLALLEHRFALVAADVRDGRSARHRTLHDAIAWSYGLLDEPERVLFIRLGVFHGSCSFDAIVAVCADAELPADAVVDILPRLVDRSLVVAEPGGADRRYRLLESLRAFAEERLSADTARTLRARLCAHLVGLGEQAQDGLRGPLAAGWIARLRSDQDNIAHVLDRAFAEASTDALRLVAALHLFWEDADLRQTGIAWAERALAAAPDAPALPRVAALAAAVSLVAPWDQPRARLLAEEAERLVAGLDAPEWLARVQLERGRVEAYGGGSESAVPALEAALAHYRSVGDDWWAAEALDLLSYVTEPARAAALLAEAHRLFERTGDRLRIANTAYLRAALYIRNLHDPVRAEPLAEEVLSVAQQLGSEHEEAHARSVLAQCALARGDDARVAELAGACLPAFRRLADHRCEAVTLLLLAQVAARRGDRSQAAAYAQATLEMARLGSREENTCDALALLADLAADADPQSATVLRAAAATWAHGEQADLDELLALARRIPY